MDKYQYYNLIVVKYTQLLIYHIRTSILNNQIYRYRLCYRHHMYSYNILILIIGLYI